MDPRCFLKTFADGKVQNEGGKNGDRERDGSEEKQADGSNSSTVLWATGRRNVLIFEGCNTVVCPQCLKRNVIPLLTTTAAFDKTVGEIWRVLYIFPLLCFLVNCCPCTVLKFHPSICSFKMWTRPTVWKSRLFSWYMRYICAELDARNKIRKIQKWDMATKDAASLHNMHFESRNICKSWFEQP